jgi:hypothetical protein
MMAHVGAGRLLPAPFFLVLALCACRAPDHTAPSPLAKLSPRLQQLLNDPRAPAPPRIAHRVMVDLTAQLDIAHLRDSLATVRVGRAARRAAVLTALRLVADSSQRRLVSLLEQLQRRGEVIGYERFIIVNRFVVSATPSGIRALAEAADVATIVEETPPSGSALANAYAGLPNREAQSWVLSAIGGRAGLDGHGVVVGIIDAGASAAHEQLRANFRDGANSWFNPSDPTARPTDILRGHATGVLSAAVGHTIGVAPGSRWIACVGIPDGHYDNVALTQCAEWMLTTAQPDILINPWQLPESGCDRSLDRIVAVWKLAEILPVFAAGNYGPEARSDRSPSNYGFSVGALGRDGRLFPRSSRGPNSCDGSIYPTIVAPGVDVPVAYPLSPSSYLHTDGSSVAAGVAAGAAALLRQRDPDATVAELEEALRNGAVDAGPRGPDNAFGYGRLSVPAALTALARIRAAANPSSSSVRPMQQ